MSADKPIGRKSLPPLPDFAAMRASAARDAEGAALFEGIGKLNYAWSNTESVFIYVLMLLLDTSDAAAAIVFSTLNTTRARLDLIARLSRIAVRDAGLREELNALVNQFAQATRLRNDLNHTSFVVDEHGAITHTQSMKLEERRGNLRFGARKPVDEQRIAEIDRSVEDLYALNYKLWKILPRLQKAALPATSRGQASGQDQGPVRPSKAPLS